MHHVSEPNAAIGKIKDFKKFSFVFSSVPFHNLEANEK